MNQLNHTIIHKSLHKPNLFFGAEREPVLLAALLPVAFTASTFNPVMAVSGLAFWIISSFFLRAAAKKDPFMVKIWLRFIKYRDFYPAKTSVWWRANNKIK